MTNGRHWASCDVGEVTYIEFDQSNECDYLWAVGNDLELTIREENVRVLVHILRTRMRGGTIEVTAVVEKR